MNRIKLLIEIDALADDDNDSRMIVHDILAAEGLYPVVCCGSECKGNFHPADIDQDLCIPVLTD